MPHDPHSRQAGFNRSTRGQWRTFAGHRERVSALLGPGRDGPPGARLCVLGAGNANDLDLPALLDSYREVHLVDLDAEALAEGVARQGVADRPGLVRHGGLDLSAMAETMAGWSARSEVRPEVLEALATWPSGRVPMVLPGPFDHVASTCLLSQLTDTAGHALGNEHPRLTAAMEAIRRGHLRLLTRLAGPVGRATLITDVSSSKLIPDLEGLDDRALADRLPRILRSGAHYHGLHPNQILAALRHDPAIAPGLAGMATAPPWRWQLHSRFFLVWAVSWRTGAPRIVA
jgi:hypothetical protein